MSSKHKRQKKNWLQCTKCNVLLNTRDRDIHEKQCETLRCVGYTDIVNDSNVNHGFILNNVLFCIVKDLQKGEDLKHIPESLVPQMVLLHPSAMSICKIAFGSKVVIISSNMCSLYTAWPSKNITSTSVCIFNRMNCVKSVVAMVIPYEKPLKAASVIGIQLCIQGDRDLSNVDRHLLIQNYDACIRPGSQLECTYFGVPLKVTVDFIVDSEGTKHEKQKMIPKGNASSFSEVTTENVDCLSHQLSALSVNRTDDISQDESNLEISPVDEKFCSTPVRKLPPNDHVKSASSMDSVCKQWDLPIDIPTFFTVTPATKCEMLFEPYLEGGDEISECVMLSNLGGLESQIKQLKDIIQLPLKIPGQFTSLGVTFPRGVLLYGPSGTGKTATVKAVVKEIGLTLISVNGPEIFSKHYGETEATLRTLFNDAKKRAPSVIFIDEIDTLCPKREKSQSEQEKRVTSTLLLLMDDLSRDTRRHVVVIACTSKPDSLDPALRRPGRLEKEIEFGVPTLPGRTEILSKMLGNVKHNLTPDEIEEIAFAAHGFTGADLEAVCKEASMQSVNHYIHEGDITSEFKITMKDMVFGLKQVKPSAMREVNLEVPKVYWKDIGGMKDVKQKLRQTIEWPLKHPEVFKRMGITPPRGLLMYGPPGCSKTMVAKALATESGLNFIAIKGPELFNKWVGESERAVREIFHKARMAAPSILFFDEIDALASERGSGGGSNVGDRVLAQLLTEMDGIEQLNGVTFIAATNRPDMIDEALMRPGRLDSIMYVPLPDTETRREILKLRLQGMPSKDVDISKLAEATHNYSGAEIVAVCNEAGMRALEEDLSAKIVTKQHFEAALSAIKPRTSLEMIQFYNEYTSEKIRRKL